MIQRVFDPARGSGNFLVITYKSKTGVPSAQADEVKSDRYSETGSTPVNNKCSLARVQAT